MANEVELFSHDLSGDAPKPASTAPENAANSATAATGPATPTPPANTPPLNKGTPPGFTAAELLSPRSAFPVTAPVPGDAPLIAVAGGRTWPLRKFTFRGQPRFVFSIP